MSLAELRRWTLERNWGDRRRQELEDYLSRYLVIHSEDELCNHWARDRLFFGVHQAATVE